MLMRSSAMAGAHGGRRACPRSTRASPPSSTRARGSDGRDVRRAARLQVFGYRAVVAHQLLDHGAGAARDGLVLLLHAAHGAPTALRVRLGGEGVADENDGRDRGQAEREPAADAESKRTACSACGTRCAPAGRARFSRVRGCVSA